MPTQKKIIKKDILNNSKTIKQINKAKTNIVHNKKINKHSEIKHKEATTAARRDFFKSLINIY